MLKLCELQDHFLYEYPKLNGECFQQFLDWLSVQLGSDYAILQIDQAPAHTSSAISWPENIIPLFQPPSAPELNPIERLWQLLKKPLHHQLFSSLQALRVSEAPPLGGSHSRIIRSTYT